MSDINSAATNKLIRRMKRTAPTLSAEAIARSTGRDVDEVRHQLAAPAGERRAGPNQRTADPAQALDQLARNPNENDRCQAAADPNCPGSLLRRLAADPSPLVRLKAAANPSCPQAALHRLAADPDAAVRHTAAQHKSYKPD